MGAVDTVVVIGDSHAEMLLPPLVAIAQRVHWTLRHARWASCPWQDGLYRFTGNEGRLPVARTTGGVASSPSSIPTSSSSSSAPLDKEGVKGLHLGGPDGPSRRAQPQPSRHRAGTDSVVRASRSAKDRDVVLEEPIPQGRRDSTRSRASRMPSTRRLSLRRRKDPVSDRVALPAAGPSRHARVGARHRPAGLPVPADLRSGRRWPDRLVGCLAPVTRVFPHPDRSASGVLASQRHPGR